MFSIQCPLWVLSWIDEVYLYYLYLLHQEITKWKQEVNLNGFFEAFGRDYGLVGNRAYEEWKEVFWGTIQILLQEHEG